MDDGLNEAIAHLEERLKEPFDCEACKQEHKELLSWLVELRWRRQVEKGICEAMEKWTG